MATITFNANHNTNYGTNAWSQYNGKICFGSIAFDSSYPTGGETVTGIPFTPDVFLASPTSGYVFEYDATNNKLLAYYADYDAVADGALIQVADETDLSALTAVPFVAFGIGR
jgi:hypothetical protein